MNQYNIIFNGIQKMHYGTDLITTNHFSDMRGRRIVILDDKLIIASYPFELTAIVSATKINNKNKRTNFVRDDYVSAEPKLVGI